MAACNKVFSTYELLEHIITFLPPRHVLKVERVCKTWKAVIEDSIRIAHARCVTPSQLLPAWIDCPDPLYAVGTDLRFNPTFTTRVWDDPYFSKAEQMPLQNQFFMVTAHGLAQSTKQCSNDYLTGPPISSISITVFFAPSGEIPQSRLARVLLESAEGLRMRDMEAVAAEATANTGGGQPWSEIDGLCIEAFDDWDHDWGLEEY